MLSRYSTVLQGLLLVILATPLQAAETAPLEQRQVVQSKGAPGSVSSVLYRKLPEGLSVEVVAFDDTETDLKIRDHLMLELEKAGQVVAAGAPLELSFSTEVVQGGDFQRQAPSLGRVGASNEQDRGTRGSDSGVDVELNVWSSSQDSVLGGRQKRKGDGRLPRYHINAQLRDRDSGQVLWQGDAYCDMLSTDRARLARSMVGPLIAAYGRSVKHQPFELK